MNPKEHQQSEMPAQISQEAVSVPNPQPQAQPSGWLPWAIGSLLIGAGALSDNTCNLNLGSQVMLALP